MVQTARRCLSCGNIVSGRRNKKYCDDNCKNDYHNKLKAEAVSSLQKVNDILYKNRSILKKLIGNETTVKASKEYLIRKGYRFDYLTNVVTNKSGNLFHFVYEYGYFKLESEIILIVKS